MIEVENVSMKFRMSSDKIQSIKEFVVAAASRRLKYKEFTVFEDVSFTVEKGEVVGIIGRNGAGKSTLLKIISGILTPTKGMVRLGGKVVPMLELGSGFDPELTGKENIFLNGAILGYSEDFLTSKYHEILEFSGLGDFIDTPIRNYSSGMMMRLAFSIATIVQPEILIVDEILAVGDEAFQKKSKRKMLELMGGGTTVLFVSHSIAQIREMCSRVIWLENGQVKMQGKTKYVCDRYQEYLTLPDKKDKRFQSSDAMRNLSNVLFIYGDDANAYEWRVTYQREQLVAAGVATNEIYVQMLNDDFAKMYRLFICVKCPDTPQMRSFLACARKLGKTILFDFSMCTDAPFTQDPQTCLMRQLPDCCDGVIASSKTIAREYEAKGYLVYENPPASEEAVLRYAALAMHPKHPGREKRMGLFSDILETAEFTQEKNEIAAMLESHSTIRLIASHAMDMEKIEFVRSCFEMDLLLLIGNEKTQELLLQQWICASFVKVPCFLYMKGQYSLPTLKPGRNIFAYTGQAAMQEELAAILKDANLRKQIGQAAYFDALKYHSSAYTGDRLGQFVKSKIIPNAAFLISDLAYEGSGYAACHHAVLLKKKGYDVLLITNGKEQKNMVCESIELPVVSRDVVYSYQFFDLMAAFDWESVQWMQNYPNAGKRFYLVQGFETDYYLPGNIKRLQANQMFTPHVEMKYAAASVWCKQWLLKKYRQDAVLLKNGISFASQKSGVQEKFSGQKIRILVTGNTEIDSENLSEAFAVTNLLSREKFEICFYPNGGNLEEWGTFDKLYRCQSEEQVWEMYCQCDILLLTSKNICSTAPLNIMAAFGAAVVMQDDSNAEYLKADENCAMFPPGDIQAASACIQRIADDKAYRDRLVENGIRTAKAYDWSNMDKEILRFYLTN